MPDSKVPAEIKAAVDDFGLAAFTQGCRQALPFKGNVAAEKATARAHLDSLIVALVAERDRYKERAEVTTELLNEQPWVQRALAAEAQLAQPRDEDAR